MSKGNKKKNEVPKTCNKGEASEFYAFAYILGNVRIPLVDDNLKPKNKNVEFLRVWRSDDCSYEIHRGSDTDPNQKDSVVIRKKGEEPCTVDCGQIKALLQELFDVIQDDEISKIPVECEQIRNLKKLLMTDTISAKSSEKADFHAEVQADNQIETASLGFSVKSCTGQNSTLINCNKDKSAMVFLVVDKNGKKIADKEANAYNEYINNLEKELKEIEKSKEPEGKKEKQELKKKKQELRNKLKVQSRIQHLEDKDYFLKFVKARNPELQFTLSVIDSNFSKILAELLLEAFGHEHKGTPSLAELIQNLSNNSKKKYITALGSNSEEVKTSLRYKVQQFLLAFMAGATVSKKWDCQDRANGGMVIVKEGGEVVCFELFTRNATGEYLLNNTYFDNPSSRRHPWGKMYCDDKLGWCMDLQLQVRFKKLKSA